MKKLVIGTVVLYFLVVTVLFGGAWYMAGTLTAPVNCDISSVPVGLDVEKVEIDGIAAWIHEVDSSKGVVLLIHGIRSSRKAMIERARFLSEAGYSSVMIDLQAHGESEGERITIGHREKENVKTVLSFVKKGNPELPVGVIGISLGGASTLLASPLDIDALILESVYPTIEQAVHNRVEHRLGLFLGWIPAELLLFQLNLRLGITRDNLKPIEHISQLNCPIFVMGGKLDVHTTEFETRTLFKQASGVKQLWIVEGAGHVDLEKFAGSEYQRRVVDFFNLNLNGCQSTLRDGLQ